MGKEGVKNEDSKFNFENFSPKIQKAIEFCARQIIEANPVTEKYIGRIFGLPKESIQKKHIEYFQKYVELVVPQLVIGAFYGANYDISEETEDGQVELIRSGPTTRLFIKGDNFFHDIAHTFVAVGRAGEGTSLSNLIPDFQRVSDKRKDYKSDKEFRKIFNQLGVDEHLADFWSPGYSKAYIKAMIQYIKEDLSQVITDPKKLEEAIREDFILWVAGNQKKFPDPYAKKIAAKVYDEFETNPAVLFEIFFEETLPYMQEHQPRAVKEFNSV